MITAPGQAIAELGTGGNGMELDMQTLDTHYRLQIELSALLQAFADAPALPLLRKIRALRRAIG